MEIRKALEQDIDTLVTLRTRQLDDEEEHPQVNIDSQVHAYFSQHLNHDLIQYLMEEDGKIIATAGIQFLSFPPGFFNPIGTRGYICSVYTDPAYRGNGYATQLLDHLVSEARNHDVTRLFLEASVWGKPVYKKYGFVDAGAMMEMKL